MISRTVQGILILLITVGLLSLGYMHASAQPMIWNRNPKIQTSSFSLYEQPIDPNGKLLPAARLEPDGSDLDENVWDEFTLPSGGTLTRLQWYGGYDPLRQGKGGPVQDFTVSLYASIAAGTEPAVASPPLVTYQVGGAAGEAAVDVINGVQLYAYAFDLPTPFMVEAGVKYWVQIQASQQGTIPDWGFASATGGTGYRFVKTSGAGGDVLYRFIPGDVALKLLGLAPVSTTTPPPTQTLPTSTTNTPIPTSTPTPVPPATPCVSAFLIPLAVLVKFRPSRR